jgi:hypothetical protein
MEEVELRQVTHDAGDMSKQVDSWVDMLRREYGFGSLGIGISECHIYVVILPGVRLDRRDIISKVVLWTQTPKTDLPLEMM